MSSFVIIFIVVSKKKKVISMENHVAKNFILFISKKKCKEHAINKKDVVNLS